MNFLDPEEWRDLEALSKQYEELTDDLVKELHVRLKPYFLRRIKSEVLQLPPKVLISILSCETVGLRACRRTRLSFLSPWLLSRRRSIGQSSVRIFLLVPFRLLTSDRSKPGHPE